MLRSQQYLAITGTSNALKIFIQIKLYFNYFFMRLFITRLKETSKINIYDQPCNGFLFPDTIEI